jgi:quercetin dioxygenase-like cupin family protein
MGVIHRYKGQFDWEGVSRDRYPPERDMEGVSVRWLIGPAEEAPHFALRYFEVEPGGWTSLDRHAHDHGVMILRGRGQVLLGEGEADGSSPVEVGFGDVVYIPPYEVHQFKNTGDQVLGFLCVIPARERSG